MKGSHSAVPSVKMLDVLANYISSYKFQFQFSLTKENGKFQ